MMVINDFMNRLRTPIPMTDRILEIVAGVMVITLFVITAILYKLSPDEVPGHFSFFGLDVESDWTGKGVFWFISGMLAFCMLVVYISAYYTDKNTVRMPIRKATMSLRQMMLAERLCRIINIALALMWLDLLLNLSAPSLHIDQVLIHILNATWVLFLFVSYIWYGIKIMRS